MGLVSQMPRTPAFRHSFCCKSFFDTHSHCSRGNLTCNLCYDSCIAIAGNSSLHNAVPWSFACKLVAICLHTCSGHFNAVLLLIFGMTTCCLCMGPCMQFQSSLLYLAIGTLSTSRHLSICICFQGLQILVTHKLSHGNLSSMGCQCQ